MARQPRRSRRGDGRIRLLLAFVALAAMTIMFAFGETLAETFAFANETLQNLPAITEEAAE